jgi:hypothetical protein
MTKPDKRLLGVLLQKYKGKNFSKIGDTNEFWNDAKRVLLEELRQKDPETAKRLEKLKEWEEAKAAIFLY